MINKFFIVGTDTNIGKTYISVKLLKHYNKLGYKTIGIKPVATGGIAKDGIILNDDGLLLQENSTVKLDYKQVNPFSFLAPVSPNIADGNLTIDKIYEKVTKTMSNKADIYIIEGAGGFQTPINYQETMADLAKKLNIPLILVVGIKLGCINHAILTYRNITSLKIPFHGWIANILDPNMEALNENITTLKNYIKSPHLEMNDFN
jgi:dethiobiotin synthetase